MGLSWPAVTLPPGTAFWSLRARQLALLLRGFVVVGVGVDVVLAAHQDVVLVANRFRQVGDFLLCRENALAVVFETVFDGPVDALLVQLRRKRRSPRCPKGGSVGNKTSVFASRMNPSESVWILSDGADGNQSLPPGFQRGFTFAFGV